VDIGGEIAEGREASRVERSLEEKGRKEEEISA